MEIDNYADYELNKLAGEGAMVKFEGDLAGETRWISITSETLAKLRDVLRDAPECSWGV